MSTCSEPPLIVGAGIAGLGLALALQRRGRPFRIVDRRAGPTNEGVGIMLTGNALRALEDLDVADAVVRAGEPVAAIDFTDDAGQPLFRLDLAAHPAWGRFTCLHRHALHRVLLAAVGEEQVSWGRRISDLRETADSVVVDWDDGSSSQHEVVAGADGVHSEIRRRLFGSVTTELPGLVGWRFLTRKPDGLEQPLYMLGNGCTLLFHPLPGGELYCGAGPAAAALAAGDGQPAQLRQVFGGFRGAAPGVLAAVTAATPLLATTYHYVDLARWHRGRCVLLGDAAHCCPPTLAQGGAMALEDGLVLAHHLATAPDPTTAFSRYEARRRPRVACVQQASLARMAANRPTNAHQTRVRNSLLCAVGADQLAAAWEPLMTESY